MKNPSPLITSLMGRHLRMMRIREIRERLRLRLADGISRIPTPPVPRPGIGICALARTLAARHCAANPEDTARFMRRLARIGGSTAHLAVPDTLISAAITLQPSTTDPGDRSVHHRDFPAFPDGILVGDTLLNAPGLTFVDDGSARFGPELVPGTVWTRIIGGGIIGMRLSTLFAFTGTPEHPFDPSSRTPTGARPRIRASPMSPTPSIPSRSTRSGTRCSRGTPAEVTPLRRRASGAMLTGP